MWTCILGAKNMVRYQVFLPSTVPPILKLSDYTPIESNSACSGGMTIVDVAILIVRSLTCSDFINTLDTPL